jgi:hypothetical protein
LIVALLLLLMGKFLNVISWIYNFSVGYQTCYTIYYTINFSKDTSLAAALMVSINLLFLLIKSDRSVDAARSLLNGFHNLLATTGWFFQGLYCSCNEDRQTWEVGFSS